MGKKGTHHFKDWRILWVLLVLIIRHLSCVPTGEAHAGIIFKSQGDRVLPGVLTLLSLPISLSLLYFLAALFLLVLLALAGLFTLAGRRACAKSCTHSIAGLMRGHLTSPEAPVTATFETTTLLLPASPPPPPPPPPSPSSLSSPSSSSSSSSSSPSSQTTSSDFCGYCYC